MIRFIRLLAVLLTLSLFSVGCRDIGRESAPNERSFVSAVGFDEQNGEWLFSLEIAGAGEEKKSRTLTQSGENMASVFGKVIAASTGDLLFTHCRAVVFGKDLSEEKFEKALSFCVEKLNIPLSARLISAEVAAELLSRESNSTNGYEISDIADQTAKKLGFGAHSALYEIETARLQPSPVFALPFFQSCDGSVQMQGLTVYMNEKASVFLNNEQSVVYAVLRNVYEGEEISFRGESQKLSSASSKIKAELAGDVLKINITLCSHPENALLKKLVRSVVEEIKIDVFGIAGLLQSENPELYKKIENNYAEYYKNAKFTVVEE